MGPSNGGNSVLCGSSPHFSLPVYHQAYCPLITNWLWDAIFWRVVGAWPTPGLLFGVWILVDLWKRVSGLAVEGS